MDAKKLAPKTSAERQREFRARKAQKSEQEVRGIFAHVDDHEAIKALTDKITRRRVRKHLSSNA